MQGEPRGTLAVPQVALAALFVTALVAAQVTAAKVVALGVPVALPLVWLAIAAPTFRGSPVAGDAFADVLGASTGVVAGSLAAYVLSQNWDVLVFDRLREVTGGAHLWLRNVASTATSQLLDTVVFVTVAFLLFQGLAPGQVLGLVVGQYAVKLLIAVLDTPFVYAVVGFVRSREGEAAAPVRGD
jgi:uncharacterized integral membrane protein (TIGR00697 family)